jgi:signal peptidase I
VEPTDTPQDPDQFGARDPYPPVVDEPPDATIMTGTVVDEPLAATPPASRRRHRKPRSGAKTALEWVLLIGSALVIALLIKTFLFQAFYIPSESMVPTLEKDDRVLVNKLSYKLHDVNRGDIVVFEAPQGADPTVKDLVKRVIGLPGDTVGARGGKVFVNDKELREPYLPQGTRTDCASFKQDCFYEGTIPKDHYWVMGDNRPSSKDSRFFGLIEKDDIVGRVFVRIWPLNRLDLL